MITLTEQAALKVKEMLQDTDNPDRQFLRIGIQFGGCSGLNYSLGFDEDKKEDDMELSQHGVKILVDQDSIAYLQGTVIDFKESMMGGGFSIDNPNAIASCGCGASFRTATEAGKPEDC
ncbi:HesB/IscA family protein [Thermoflavimicrobium daqui]|jgi:iron-sulfur cluster assembly protein|uniref:Iron-sulfur cluster assembly accessory protein n=1 Tax=Thermoflavimicrobium daqui TaxID=2137476 RepID=A0A364K9J4_9BACL|nr:iron-sulfur cluster assembly accessory protein [Thermoflavimicrobium daqui]RAL26976.1 iron-sulfur cluster assembly accessory protein [Thermoflavimicrobium daqui]